MLSCKLPAQLLVIWKKEPTTKSPIALVSFFGMLSFYSIYRPSKLVEYYSLSMHRWFWILQETPWLPYHEHSICCAVYFMIKSNYLHIIFVFLPFNSQEYRLPNLHNVSCTVIHIIICRIAEGSHQIHKAREWKLWYSPAAWRSADSTKWSHSHC